MSKNLILQVFLILVIISGSGYLVYSFVVPMPDIPQETGVNIPADNIESKNAMQDEVKSQVNNAEWETFMNTAFGYRLKYPGDVAEPINLCGDVLGFDQRPVDLCDEVAISLNSGAAPDEAIIIKVLDNPDRLSLDEFVSEVLSSAVIESMQQETISSLAAYSAIFSGPLYTIPDGGGENYEGKTAALWIVISNNQILRVTHPLEFCFVMKYSEEFQRNMRFKASCFSDERNQVYKLIISTLQLADS